VTDLAGEIFCRIGKIHFTGLGWNHAMKRFALAYLAVVGVLMAAPPNTSIKAQHYCALRAVLIPGDFVYAFAPRDPAQGGPSTGGRCSGPQPM